MLVSISSIVVSRLECVVGFGPPKLMKNACRPSTNLHGGMALSLSSRAQPRDLRFSKFFVEMFSTMRRHLSGGAAGF
jgi:hypothetical protein